VQGMQSSVCSLTSFCGAVNSRGGIIMYVVYVVSCVEISCLPTVEYCGCSCSKVLVKNLIVGKSLNVGMKIILQSVFQKGDESSELNSFGSGYGQLLSVIAP
jgi:hypothetical protein